MLEMIKEKIFRTTANNLLVVTMEEKNYKFLFLDPLGKELDDEKKTEYIGNGQYSGKSINLAVARKGLTEFSIWEKIAEDAGMQYADLLELPLFKVREKKLEWVYQTDFGNLLYVKPEENGYEFSLFESDGTYIGGDLLEDDDPFDVVTAEIAEECLSMVDDSDFVKEETDLSWNDIEGLPLFEV